MNEEIKEKEMVGEEFKCKMTPLQLLNFNKKLKEFYGNSPDIELPILSIKTMELNDQYSELSRVLSASLSYFPNNPFDKEMKKKSHDALTGLTIVAERERDRESDYLSKEGTTNLYLAMINDSLPFAFASDINKLSETFGWFGVMAYHTPPFKNLVKPIKRVCKHYLDSSYEIKPYESVGELFQERIHSASLVLCFGTIPLLKKDERDIHKNLIGAYTNLMLRSVCDFRYRSEKQEEQLKKKNSEGLADIILADESLVIPAAATHGLLNVLPSLKGSVEYYRFRKITRSREVRNIFKKYDLCYNPPGKDENGCDNSNLLKYLRWGF